MKRLVLISLFAVTVVAVNAAPPAGPASKTTTAPAIVTYQNGNSRLGQNTQETILTPANVNATNFGQLFNWQTDGNIYAQPLYVPNLTINGSVHNVVFVVTEADGIYAFAADSHAGPVPRAQGSVHDLSASRHQRHAGDQPRDQHDVLHRPHGGRQLDESQ